MRLGMLGAAGMAIAMLAAPATAAGAMTVSDFLAKADALQKRGPVALFSADYRLLRREAMAAGKAVRADQTAAVAAGRTPATCMPAKAPTNSSELLAHFRAIPAPRRAMSVKDGMTLLMRRKFPCPA